MVYTFTFVKTAVGKTKDVFEKLKGIARVENVHAVFGEWDVICIAKVDALAKAAETVLDKIHKIDGIKNTSTLIEAEI